MSFLGTLKSVTATVATGGLNKVADKAAKTPALKTVNAVLNPVTQLKTAAKAQQAVAKRVDSGLRAMHLTSVANQLNVRNIVKDPKSIVTGYADDVAFAGEFYARVKKGDASGLLKQAVKETTFAVTGSNKAAAAAEAKIAPIADKLKKPATELPVTDGAYGSQSVMQVTDVPLPPTDQTYAMPVDVVTPSETATPKKGNMVLVLGGIAAALVLLVVVTR